MIHEPTPYTLIKSVQQKRTRRYVTYKRVILPEYDVVKSYHPEAFCYKKPNDVFVVVDGHGNLLGVSLNSTVDDAWIMAARLLTTKAKKGIIDQINVPMAVEPAHKPKRATKPKMDFELQMATDNPILYDFFKRTFVPPAKKKKKTGWKWYNKKRITHG